MKDVLSTGGPNLEVDKHRMLVVPCAECKADSHYFVINGSHCLAAAKTLNWYVTVLFNKQMLSAQYWAFTKTFI